MQQKDHRRLRRRISLLPSQVKKLEAQYRAAKEALDADVRASAAR